MKRMCVAALVALAVGGCASMRQGVREGLSGNTEPWIRVGLATDVPAFEISSDRDMVLRLREPGASATRTRVPRSIGRTLSASLGGSLSLEGGNHYREDLPAEDTLLIDPASHSSDARFQWNGKHYTGRFMVFRSPRNTLTVVNILPLERYLAGVVPAEIGNAGADGAEAVKAQAVAARTYTLFFLGRRASEGFDVFGTVEDQVYGGLEAENPQTGALIESTRGQVVLEDGRPIRAMYSSDCGGMLASVDEAFPAQPLPYLIEHRDRSPELGATESFCSQPAFYRWREEWGLSEFEAILGQYGPREWQAEDGRLKGRVLDVTVLERSASGRVRRLEIETTAGPLALSEMQIRGALRRPSETHPILRSTLFRIGVEYEGGTPVKVVATGAGNGHGVGLCQYGARGMASRGYVYEQILYHYYRGTRLATWYS